MKLLGDCGYSRDDIQTILDAPIPYTKAGGQKEVELTEVCQRYWAQQTLFWFSNLSLCNVAIQKLLATLSSEQVEQAALSSYAYFLASISDKPPTEQERIKMAKRECRRHIVKSPLEKAPLDILETLKYRKVPYIYGRKGYDLCHEIDGLPLHVFCSEILSNTSCLHSTRIAVLI